MEESFSTKIKFFIWFCKLKLQGSFWNKRLKLWWYRLWIRKDEFHSSLSMDALAMSAMNEKERE